MKDVLAYEDVPFIVEVIRVFEDAEDLNERTRVRQTLCKLTRTKSAFLGVYFQQKRLKRSPMITEHVSS